jgi:ribosomal protein L11 methylase PrmA
VYAEQYDRLIDTGLYQALADARLLIPHRELEIEPAEPAGVYKIIQPEQIPFISYPYEWSFSQLRDAALTTLEIQERALEYEMSLKDCSAYNIQFIEGKPVLIDTLSFEAYREGHPWVAYRQFCQHFLAPLALAACVDIRLTRLSRDFIDGVPLDLASRLLPLRTRLNPALFLHIHLHAGSQRKYAGTTTVRRRKVSRLSMRGLNDNLSAAVKRLRWHPGGTEWGDYYDATNYTGTAMESKPRIVGEFIARVAPRTVWDLGANTGVFSRIASTQQIDTIAFDVDPAAVEKNYIETRRRDESHLLPLVMDLTNPSPPMGWDHEERASLVARGPADMALALALIHHLAISNNVPLEKIARFLARICRSLVIEFVPKEDSQVKRLLATRQDIFPDYTIEGFTAAFARYFEIVDQRAVEDSERTLFLMRRRES